MITADDFITGESNDKGNISDIKFAVVNALFANGTAKILFDGEDAPSEKQFAYISTYSPKIGDKVIMSKVAGSYVLIGKIAYNKSPSGKKVDDLISSASTSAVTSKVNEIIGVLRNYGFIS